jgi:hypothetical protein
MKNKERKYKKENTTKKTSINAFKYNKMRKKKVFLML